MLNYLFVQNKVLLKNFVSRVEWNCFEELKNLNYNRDVPNGCDEYTSFPLLLKLKLRSYLSSCQYNNFRKRNILQFHLMNKVEKKTRNTTILCYL